jgi:predicted phosphodiesterase
LKRKVVFLAANWLVLIAVACFHAVCCPDSAPLVAPRIAYRIPPFVHRLDEQHLTGRQEHRSDSVFVFATIADSHIGKGTFCNDLRFIKAIRIADRLLDNYVRDINSHVPDVDFVIHLGDVTETGTAGEFAKAKRIMDRLECPSYWVVGNHDNFQSDNKRNWKSSAGTESTYYTFDYKGYHFIVVDCTPNPYNPQTIACDSTLRAWVSKDLAVHCDNPALLFSHYNLWERSWGANFDTTGRYPEYRGMAELREVLERAGNVVAVISGHVHANRVEVHRGIYYIDIGATLIGRPSVRYFEVFPDRIDVTYEYISGELLLDEVVDVSADCSHCFDPARVCDFIDGRESDKRFTMPVRIRSKAGRGSER